VSFGCGIASSSGAKTEERRDGAKSLFRASNIVGSDVQAEQVDRKSAHRAGDDAHPTRFAHPSLARRSICCPLFDSPGRSMRGPG